MVVKQLAKDKDIELFSRTFKESARHTMSELALIIPKSPKSFDHSEFLFKHWTKLFPKN